MAILDKIHEHLLSTLESLHLTEEGFYGPGSFVDTSFTPVPIECERVLRLLAAKTPGFTKDTALLERVQFEGPDIPCIPGPLKSEVVTAALHAMTGIVGLEILKLKGYETDSSITIYTDQASLYCNMPGLVTIDGLDGPAVLQNPSCPPFDHGAISTPLNRHSEAIYPTKTPNVWYQIHGSTDPAPLLTALGVDPHAQIESELECYEHIKAHVINYTAPDLELMMIERGFPGNIVYSPEGWLKTQMGKSLARHPLINYREMTQLPHTWAVPFPHATGKLRPLTGIKVLELARIIAAPACGAILASFGATVTRVQSGRMTDFTPAQLSLMAGKKAYDVDLNDEGAFEKVLQLVDEADVIIQAYRIGCLERRGLGLDAIAERANKRGKGIIYLDVNCYGPDGIYRERPGYQQSADAAAGSEWVMGKSYGLEDGHGVLPSLPISDMSTGVVSALDIMMMLRDRAIKGGSYHGTSSLTGYNAFTLVKEIGLYQPEVVAAIQEKYKFEEITSDLHVVPLFYQIAQAWKDNSDLTTDEKYYVHFDNSVYGKDLRIVAPMVRYDDKAITPRWDLPPLPFCHSGTEPSF